MLNPLGVPSRMNVGQILETHLGWACANLGQQIGELVDQWQDGVGRKVLEDRLEHMYGEETGDEIRGYSDGELLELGDNLRPGVPIATPVFDGAHEADIVRMLEEAGCASSGQVTLTDGRTGEPFDRPVTVGYIYMLKLGPPGRRQDPRPFGRPLQPRHPAAAGRQGAVRRPALRRDGVLGTAGLRRLLLAAGDADGEVRRRVGPHQDLRGDRARRGHVRGRRSRKASTCSSRSCRPWRSMSSCSRKWPASDPGRRWS